MKQEKPLLPLSTIINMSMGFLGIQMAFALQNANASRIFQNFGAEIESLSWFWLVAPITGLIVQPIIGHMGDHTWSEKWGRRKPYFLIGAVLTAIALVFLPNSASVTHVMAGSVLLFAVIFLAMMDASINISMEPFRALVGDMLNKKQGTLGFSVQTILIGIGAVIGSNMPHWLTYLGVANTAPEGYVSDTVIYSFYIGAIVLLLTIVYTVLTTKEYGPKDFERFTQDSESVASKEKAKLSDIFRDFGQMPALMRSLGAVQFFSWFALFTMWVFTTPAIATHHYGLPYTDVQSETYNIAANQVGVLFGYYNLFAVGFAFALIPLARIMGKKYTHALALLCGGVGLISLYFIQDTNWLWVSMLGIGFAWASILAMPYAMLIDALPLKKMGVFMGIFNFFIVLPQIVNGIIGGPVVKAFFGNYAIGYLVLGGVLMIIAAIISMMLKGVDSDTDTSEQSAI
ncbi:MAG: MFS transporter [Weeksellaceae bacterium]|nr:MFS transporter [Weeksellaceae bacterium]